MSDVSITDLIAEALDHIENGTMPVKRRKALRALAEYKLESVTTPTEDEHEYRRRRPVGIQPNATFDSLPALNEGEWVQRRLVGEWEDVPT